MLLRKCYEIKVRHNITFVLSKNTVFLGALQLYVNWGFQEIA